MSFFDDEEMLHDEGLCDPSYCRFCQAEETPTKKKETKNNGTIHATRKR